MIRPTLELAVALNAATRHDDEWFDEPDDIERLSRALSSIEDMQDVIAAAGVLAYRVTRAQAFGEGNKRTALLLARWVLDHNGHDGARALPPDDRDFADLLIKAASEHDVEADIVSLLQSRLR